LVFAALALFIGAGDCGDDTCATDADCLADNEYCDDGDGICAEKCPQADGDRTDGSPCQFDTDCDSENCDNDTSTALCSCVGGGTGGSGGSGGTGGTGGTAVSCALCGQLDCAEFTDDAFALADWDAAKVYATENTYGVDQRSDDGNPAPPYRFISHTIGENSSIWVAHDKGSAIYDPGAKGAIQSIHYSFDGKALLDSRQASIRPLAKQDGTWFWTAFTSYQLINEDGWVTKEWPDANLVNITMGGVELDLTKPITFGFASGASHTVGVEMVTRNTGVDNWRVIICNE